MLPCCHEGNTRVNAILHALSVGQLVLILHVKAMFGKYSFYTFSGTTFIVNVGTFKFSFYLTIDFGVTNTCQNIKITHSDLSNVFRKIKQYIAEWTGHHQ